jgi:hypothetical protein
MVKANEKNWRQYALEFGVIYTKKLFPKNNAEPPLTPTLAALFFSLLRPLSTALLFDVR